MVGSVARPTPAGAAGHPLGVQTLALELDEVEGAPRASRALETGAGFAPAPDELQAWHVPDVPVPPAADPPSGSGYALEATGDGRARARSRRATRTPCLRPPGRQDAAGQSTASTA